MSTLNYLPHQHIPPKQLPVMDLLPTLYNPLRFINNTHIALTLQHALLSDFPSNGLDHTLPIHCLPLFFPCCSLHLLLTPTQVQIPCFVIPVNLVSFGKYPTPSHVHNLPTNHITTHAPAISFCIRKTSLSMNRLHTIAGRSPKRLELSPISLTHDIIEMTRQLKTLLQKKNASEWSQSNDALLGSFTLMSTSLKLTTNTTLHILVHSSTAVSMPTSRLIIVLSIQPKFINDTIPLTWMVL